MSMYRTFKTAVAASLILAIAAGSALACPFCSAPSLTLTEQVGQADAVILTQWTAAEEGDEKQPGSTTVEVVEIVKAPEGTVAKGDRITLAGYREGKSGDLFFLTGTKGTTIEWGSPLEVTEASYQYIVQAPSKETPTQKRLEYFVRFLEYPDELVAADAYGEFANAPYEDITPLADRLPAKELRTWVSDPETTPTRLGLYGLLLGLCGTKEDAEIMKEKITEPTQDFRLGIDGVISGYLMLAGEEGLDVIDETKLANENAAFSETYAAMSALRFMWQYSTRIPKDRLRESMRILLDRPELADLVIADLARWEDWSVQERLMTLYGAEGYNIPSIKRSIVRYMLASAKQGKRPPGTPKQEAQPAADEPKPEHSIQALAHLEQLREKDPKTVKEAERFFFIQ